MNWYIVQSYSGFEKKVVESIKDELKKNKLSEKLTENDDVETKYEKLGELKNSTTQLTYEINEADSKVLALSSMIESLEKDIVINDKSIDEYYECKDIIEFNKILEAKTGIEYYKEYSAAKAKTVGASKGKFKFFIPPKFYCT